MQQANEELPTKLETPAAVVQQQTEFGDVNDYGEISVERMQLGAGTDIIPRKMGE